MTQFINHLQRFLKSEDGPTTVEYAVMLALILVVCLASINHLGRHTVEHFDDVADLFVAAGG